jgi:hypothetical protein
LVLVALCACSQAKSAADAAPSDEAFLAAREKVAATLVRLFEAEGWHLAPDPEGTGYGGVKPTTPDVPALEKWVAVGKTELPAATPRLAGCRRETMAALAGFAAIPPAPFEGRETHIRVDELWRESERKYGDLVKAYCRWQAATRVCRAEAESVAAFEPRFLECPK